MSLKVPKVLKSPIKTVNYTIFIQLFPKQCVIFAAIFVFHVLLYGFSWKMKGDNKEAPFGALDVPFGDLSNNV